MSDVQQPTAESIDPAIAAAAGATAAVPGPVIPPVEEAVADRPALDPAVAALCTPIAPADPCGPDLDLKGDADYLNFFAFLESALPTSFFSDEDGKPYEPTNLDIEGQLASLKRLFGRSRDIRLLLAQARLFILARNLAGLAVSVAAIGEWLNTYWDAVHPRPQGGDLNARLLPLSALDLPTVTFALQYAPLFQSQRKEPITYRAWMVANGETKARPGDPDLDAAVIAEALNDADAVRLAVSRRNVAMLKSGLEAIRNAFLVHGSSAKLQAISALVDKIRDFIDPHAGAAATETPAGEGIESGEVQAKSDSPRTPAGPVPTTTSDASEALAAIAEYYSRLEPSSPTLPLVRQAHQLIGKSFLEIITVLVPGQVDKAAFQIGTDQVFDLPVGKLSALSGVAATGGARSSGPNGGAEPGERSHYRVESRSQAIALLDQVQQYFRRSEPSSPVPMLCQRARALAERDFMAVLRDVLPKSALKNVGTDK